MYLLPGLLVGAGGLRAGEGPSHAPTQYCWQERGPGGFPWQEPEGGSRMNAHRPVGVQKGCLAQWEGHPCKLTAWGLGPLLLGLGSEVPHSIHIRWLVWPI